MYKIALKRIFLLQASSNHLFYHHFQVFFLLFCTVLHSFKNATYIPRKWYKWYAEVLSLWKAKMLLRQSVSRLNQLFNFGNAEYIQGGKDRERERGNGRKKGRDRGKSEVNAIAVKWRNYALCSQSKEWRRERKDGRLAKFETKLAA